MVQPPLEGGSYWALSPSGSAWSWDSRRARKENRWPERRDSGLGPPQRAPGAPTKPDALGITTAGGPIIRRSLPVLVLALCVAGCRASFAPSPRYPTPLPSRVGPHWTDVTESAGIRFRHENGASGRKYMPETMGSGTAFLDYDGDGWLDLFLVNSRPLPGEKAKHPSLPCLLHNRGDGTFEDVTAGSGLDHLIYGMGCAAADYDGDGRLDLYISACLDSHRLYRNLGGGKFQDVTARCGLGDRRWGTSCAWLDYDRD